MPEIRYITTREFDFYDGEHARWRVNDKIMFNRNEVIWRFQTIHNYWIQDNAGSDPPADNFDIQENVVYLGHEHFQYISPNVYCLKELKYGKHNGLWHVSSRVQEYDNNPNILTTQNEFDLFIHFKSRSFCVEYEFVTGPDPLYHHLNNAYIKDNFIQQLAHKKFVTSDFFKTHKANIPALGITSKKTFTENMIALNEAELKVLKKARTKRKGVKGRIEQTVTETMNKLHARDLFKYGSTDGTFVQLSYCQPQQARLIFKEIEDKLDPLNPYDDNWANMAILKQSPFSGMGPDDVGFGNYNINRPDGSVILRNNTVGMNSIKERPNPVVDDIKSKERTIQKKKLKMMIDGTPVHIRTVDILTDKERGHYNKRNADLGFISLNDYAYSLLKQYLTAFTNEGLLNIQKMYYHKRIARNNDAIPSNGSLIAYIDEGGEVTHMIRVHLWRSCKAIKSTKKILDLRDLLVSRNVYMRDNNEFRVGISWYKSGTPKAKTTDVQQFTLDDLFMTTCHRRRFGPEDRYTDPVPVTSQFYHVETDAFLSFSPPQNDLIEYGSYNPVEQIETAAEYKVVKLFRQQKFFYDRLGHNVKVTIRTEPVMILYIIK
jgi:hypothetical protein